jgi:hypothetical protein
MNVISQYLFVHFAVESIASKQLVCAFDGGITSKEGQHIQCVVLCAVQRATTSLDNSLAGGQP